MIATAPGPAQAQAKLIKNLFSHVMKSAEVDAHFAKIQDSWDVYTKTNHAVTFRVSTKKLPATEHMEADEYWFVRKGTARVVLHTGTPATSSPQDVGSGDVLYVPRNVPYEIDPGKSRFEYVPLPEPTTYVGRKADIDKTFADELRTTQLRFPGGVNVAMIIYNGAVGPYESHEDIDQIYFVRHGTAKAAYDGRLVNPVVTTPGQIRGTGYVDASEYTIAPGDIVWIPRNQLHFVDPGTGKIGYFLISLPTSQSGFPEP
jgi:mannose-6-phosphate isomerase-like protein (cupin superfamily)